VVIVLIFFFVANAIFAPAKMPTAAIVAVFALIPWLQ